MFCIYLDGREVGPQFPTYEAAQARADIYAANHRGNRYEVRVAS